jgi:hypothetical protein
MVAEKCDAVFGLPIVLQVNGIDHVYDFDALIQIANVIVAAGLYHVTAPPQQKNGHFGPRRPNSRNWTFHLKNGPHRAHGKRDFPAEPT